MLGRTTGWAAANPNAHALLRAVWFIDLGLLVFNILPVYPLDGGQMLRSLLWFFLGRARSLMAVTIMGFIGVAGFTALAVWTRSIWLGIIAGYMLLNCWGGLQQARALLRFARLPRRPGFECPGCKSAPPVGDFWKCSHCGQAFDTFLSQAQCPNCRAQFALTKCLDCGSLHPLPQWMSPALATLQPAIR
jgi:hypothetical protein